MSDESVLADMKHNLTHSGQWDRWVEPDEVTRVRALGRRAGRELGWKISTHHHAASNSDRVRVLVILNESTPLHQELLRIRGEKQIRAAWDKIYQSWGKE